MTGRLVIVGLGPGAPDLLTPRAAETLRQATDLVGYAPYLARVPERGGHLACKESTAGTEEGACSTPNSSCQIASPGIEARA